MDVCEQDVNDPGFRTITRCSASKGFETRTKCVKSCTEASCATTTSGPLGCIQIEKGYAIERTCGPAPASLVGHKWLATYKSDYTNCTGSILTFGEIADGSCFPVSATYGEQLECTEYVLIYIIIILFGSNLSLVLRTPKFIGSTAIQTTATIASTRLNEVPLKILMSARIQR